MPIPTVALRPQILQQIILLFPQASEVWIHIAVRIITYSNRYLKTGLRYDKEVLHSTIPRMCGWREFSSNFRTHEHCKCCKKRSLQLDPNQLSLGLSIFTYHAFWPRPFPVFQRHSHLEWNIILDFFLSKWLGLSGIICFRRTQTVPFRRNWVNFLGSSFAILIDTPLSILDTSDLILSPWRWDPT